MSKNLKERSMRDEDLQRLAQRYKEGDREALKEILLDKNVKRMIETIAGQNAIPEYGLTEEDMVGYIYLHIIEKIDQYNESKSNLLTFIYIMADSACTSSIQRHSNEIKVPQKHHRIMGKLQKAEERLYQKLERDPTVGELAGAVGMSVKEIDNVRSDMMAPEQYSHSSCDEIEEDRWEGVDSDIVQPDSSFAPGGLGREEWLEMFEELTENESKVMVLHYFHGRSFPDIARFLGMTPQHIRRLHEKTLQKMREIAKK